MDNAKEIIYLKLSLISFQVCGDQNSRSVELGNCNDQVNLVLTQRLQLIIQLVLIGRIDGGASAAADVDNRMVLVYAAQCKLIFAHPKSGHSICALLADIAACNVQITIEICNLAKTFALGGVVCVETLGSLGYYQVKPLPALCQFGCVERVPRVLAAGWSDFF